jgi:uncharacterized 2Fe-2S/4Fe-4S cluster protein (DUF4445 family)
MPKQVKTILDVLQEQHQPIVAPCNGQKICGKCKIVLDPSTSINETEKRLLSETEISRGIRLACTRSAASVDDVKLVLDIEHMSILSTVSLPEDRAPYLVKKSSAIGYELYRFDTFLGTSTSPHIYAIIVDIGTTTCAVVLLDITIERVVEERVFLNPQTRYGSDVIHRIQYANSPKNINTLKQLIVTQIDQSIVSLLESNGIAANDVIDVVIAGNTTMNYLLLGYDPFELAQAPYHASHTNQVVLPYEEVFGRKMDTTVTIFASFDAFVGGDILSGIYALNMHQQEGYHMLVDLGTNGEIVLGNKDKLYMASTAAGPAFEGVNITHGIGAIPGAIDTFHYPNQFTTIKQKEPNGICGSGLIDIVSELLQHGIIQPSGYMTSSYSITKDIALTPTDVREVQLAKAAIRAGMEYLMNVANVSSEEIKTLYIAGGFGHHINFDNLKHLGMIPPSLHDKITIVGNTSLAGCATYLFKANHDDLKKIQERSKIVNLGTSKEFQDLFIEHIAFHR